MANFNTSPSEKDLRAGEKGLRENDYPGRVIIMGLATDGETALQAYALTGRSEPSRNRKFIQEGKVIRTVAPGLTEAAMAKVEDAELIYYKAMLEWGGLFVVSNGAQTEHILDSLEYNDSLEAAVKSAPTVKDVKGQDIDLSIYEPDVNHTPRIAGLAINEGTQVPFELSVVRQDPQTGEPVYTTAGGDMLALEPGVGFGVQTYNGNSDGLLPSFDRQPYPYPMGETAGETAHSIWKVLNKDKRVAIVVRSIDLNTDNTEYHIINAIDS